MTNSEVIAKVLGDRDRICVWQITPQEMPRDMRSMGLELWETSDGEEWMFVLFPESHNHDAPEWYMHVGGYHAYRRTE